MKCIKLFQKGEDAMAGRNGKFKVSLIHKILGHTEALIRVGFGQGEHQHEQFQDAEPDKVF